MRKTFNLGWALPAVYRVADFTSAQSGTTVWTPEPGRRIVLWTILFTTKVAGEMTLLRGKNNSQIIPKLQFDVNAGYVHATEVCICELDVDEVIKINTNIAGNHGIGLYGFEV